jgi:hypothetical protein
MPPDASDRAKSERRDVLEQREWLRRRKRELGIEPHSRHPNPSLKR